MPLRLPDRLVLIWKPGKCETYRIIANYAKLSNFFEMLQILQWLSKFSISTQWYSKNECISLQNCADLLGCLQRICHSN